MLHLLLAIKSWVIIVRIGCIKQDPIVVVLVEAKSTGPAILALFLGHEEGQNIFLATKIVLGWSPHLDLLSLANGL